MEQEFDLTPSPPKRRRFWLVTGCAILFVLFLCAGAAWVYSSFLTDQNDPLLTQELRTVPDPQETAAVHAETTANLEDFGRIAFVGPEGQVGTVGGDGSNLQVLTEASNQVFLFPAWSPDGLRLAAIGSDRRGAGVYLLDQSADSLQELYYSESESAFYLYWAPDGERITFLANHRDGIGLHLVDADEAGASRLLEVGQPFYWEWAPDSSSLFYHAGLADPDARLAFLDLAEGTSGENLSQPGYFQAPGISHDGQYVAFAEVDAAEARWLVIEDVTGAEQQRVPHFGLATLTWSPTEPLLAFMSPDLDDAPGAGFFGTLRVLDPESGESRLISDALVLSYYWSPDGKKLAYISPSLPSDDLIAAQEARSGRRGKAVLQQDEEPVLLQLWVADVESGESRLLFAFEPTLIYVSQFLPFFDQYALSHRVWAPNSDALVLPVVEEGAERIYVVPLDGEPKVVAEGSIAFWSPR